MIATDLHTVSEVALPFVMMSFSSQLKEKKEVRSGVSTVACGWRKVEVDGGAYAAWGLQGSVGETVSE